VAAQEDIMKVELNYEQQKFPSLIFSRPDSGDEHMRRMTVLPKLSLLSALHKLEIEQQPKRRAKAHKSSLVVLTERLRRSMETKTTELQKMSDDVRNKIYICFHSLKIRYITLFGR